MKLEQLAKLSGTVTKFKGNGRRLGYPTANLMSTKTGLGLDDGIYFGFADLAGWVRQPAVIFVGVPTTMGDSDRRVEAYLLDIPDQDYYGQSLKLAVRHYHRANQTFANTRQLLEAMKADEAAARQWFKKNPG